MAADATIRARHTMHTSPIRRRTIAALTLTVAAVLAGLLSTRVAADDSDRLLTIDHYIRSTTITSASAPSMLYVRERAQAGVVARGPAAASRVVLFVHGAGTPAEVSFDVPYRDFSWMGYLASAGFDVFAVDMTGYGRSSRTPAMNDPCNIPKDRQPE